MFTKLSPDQRHVRVSTTCNVTTINAHGFGLAKSLPSKTDHPILTDSPPTIMFPVTPTSYGLVKRMAAAAAPFALLESNPTCYVDAVDADD